MRKELKLQFLTTTTALITAAFGMVAALAWNSAISAIITEFLGTSGSGLWTMVIYAVVVTLIAVIATVYIARIATKAKEDMDKSDPVEKKREQWKAEWEEAREKEAYIKQLESQN